MRTEYIPVCRPLLPQAAAIADYIRTIDARRFYTNRGPLTCLLEERLAGHLGQPAHVVRTASSGTAALEVAILAAAGSRALPSKDRRLALLPAFTFAATALAVERCGFRPHFVDVDATTWMPDPDALLHHPLIGQAGLIVVVAPYGVMPDMRALENLQAATGVPVVVDAAAAFEQILDHPELISPTVPVMVSFHATKTFSTGEGGAVLWDSREGQDRVVQVANFGFRGSRECRIGGTNAKMSEYHAAVGLAMLDSFTDRRRDYARVARLYRDLAAGQDLGGRLHLPPAVSSAYVLFEAQDGPTFLQAETTLLDLFVETRRWYESGLHVQPHFAREGQDPLPVTADLSARLLGLPVFPDMGEADILSILAALRAALSVTTLVTQG